VSLSRSRGSPQKLLVEEAAHARDNTTLSISDRVAAAAARWPPKDVHQAGGARPCVAKAFHVLSMMQAIVAVIIPVSGDKLAISVSFFLHSIFITTQEPYL
jgi:hypothetical protein